MCIREDEMIANICLKQYIMVMEKYIATSVTDINGIITYVSPAFCNLTGYRSKELIGKKHAILRHPDMDDTLYKELWETIVQGKSWQGRIRNYAKNKISYWIDICIEPIFQNKVIIGYQAVEQNITKETFFETLAKIDTLTGLYSRLAIEEYTVSFICEAQKYKHPLSIIMVDLDNFKQFNDLFGHQAGDEILKKNS
jgi:PAS domain S-box-containing protein